jgi:phosphatidate phosphatase APP1
VTTEDGRVASCPLFVVGPDTTFGIVSDIDDTVVDTRLPRPLIAFWNTFVLHPRARHAVPGMADLYARLGARYPDAPFVYLSTGAWSTAATLRRFLDVHGFPPGPLLLTDWGPTNTGWFRSGAAHKRAQLERLFAELPQIRWLLVGDDGQHDPAIYERAAHEHPASVAAVAIRQLTPAQQVLSHGLPVPLPPPRGTEPWQHAGPGSPGAHHASTPPPDGSGGALNGPTVPVVRGPDGAALLRALLGTAP